MTKLSVNINKVATIRNARGGNRPDAAQFAIDCELFGAEGITVHPRPDERHITRNDVYQLKKVVKTELNIEGYPSDDFIKMVLEIKPEQVTLVPDPPHVLTSNAGWDAKSNLAFLKSTIETLHQSGIRTSIFMDTDLEQLDYAAQTGTKRVELYTEAFARNYKLDKNAAVLPYVKAAQKALSLGLELNAGHDLDLDNLTFFKNSIPELLEVSIGHALICDALYLGIENTINMYKRCLH